MRIVVNTISTKKGSGGAFQIAYNFLMETLKHSEIEWYYITSNDIDEAVGEKFESLKGDRYFVFPTQPDFGRTYKRVKKELSIWEDRYKPDVIYTISSPCYFSFKTHEVMRFANAYVTNPTKESWKVMPWKAWLRMRLYRLNQIRLLRKAEYLITQSDAVKKGLIRITGLPDCRVKVVPNVLPLVFKNARVEHVADNKWIDVLCIAAPVPHKNLDIISSVIRVLKDKYGIGNVRFHLTIPEDTSLYKRIASDFSSNGLSECLVNHGRCTQQQLIDIYNQGDICLLPTLLETFSASSLEAMYFGLPIVATDFEFNREVIDDAGLYYKPMDAEDAASKIALIIKDKTVEIDLKEKMAKRIVSFNDYGTHFVSIVNFLTDIVHNNLPK